MLVNGTPKSLQKGLNRILLLNRGYYARVETAMEP